MEIHLTPDQEAFISRRVRSGRFATADDAVREAVSLLKTREAANDPEEASSSTRSDEQVTAQELTGESLIVAMQASPYREIELEPYRPSLPVRDITL